jgi:TPR repeat protein
MEISDDESRELCKQGERYLYGDGVKKDYEAAYRILLKVAASEPQAQCLLGDIFFDGLGLAANQAEAANRYRSGAEHGHALSQLRYGLCVKEGKGVDKNPKQAFEWIQKAALQNNAAAQFSLREYYFLGSIVARDFNQGFKLLEMSADGGHTPAQFELGYRHEHERGKTDMAKACKYYTLAAEAGHADAQVQLAMFHQSGKGGAVDMESAIQWYEIVADNRSGDGEARALAMVKLGLCFYYGRGKDVNKNSALDLFRQAADAGNHHGQYILGMQYVKGDDLLEKNWDLGVEWLKKSAAQGTEEAKKWLRDHNIQFPQ